jgi:predicted 2-oxoglutarate/Fe(II)-dependent dioxygenase YbiX
MDSPLPIVAVENFLAPELCKQLLDGFERNTQHVDQRSRDPYWRDRLLYYQALAHEPELRRIMSEARTRTVTEISRFFGVSDVLYSDTVHMVRWREGQAMSPHADNCELDGRPNAYPWREFASLVYLNDDYEGGEVFFPTLNIQIKPSTGLLLAFRGGREHVHGVSKITRGTRYTMPAWHTRDATRRDRAFDVLP